MCEVVGVELYWKLIAKMMGLVCEVVARFLHGVVFIHVSNRVKHVLQTCCFPSNED